MTVADIYGPNSAQVVAFIEATKTLTLAQWQSRDTSDRDTWDQAQCAAWDAACTAAQAASNDDSRYYARNAAMSAAWDAASTAAKEALLAQDALDGTRSDPAYVERLHRDTGFAAWVAAWALVVRDLISPDHFTTLTAYMRSAGITFEEETR